MPAPKPIRVVYDISLLAHFFTRGHAHSGIGRVAQALLATLNQRRDIDLTATNLCGYEHGPDVLFDAVSAQLYLEAHGGDIAFDPSFRSRLQLTRSYQNHFRRIRRIQANPELEFEEQPSRRIYNRIALGLLYRLAYRYKLDALTPALHRRDYDILHSPFPALPAPALTADCARVLTVYDLIPLVAPQFVEAKDTAGFAKLLSSLRPEHDWATCISQFSKDELCEYTRIAPERVRVTPLAAQPHFRMLDDSAQIEDVQKRHGIPDGPYLLTLAEMQPRKNLPHLLRCFAEVLEADPNREASLVLVGRKGWMFDEIFATARELSKWQSRIIFTGQLSDADLVALYNGARGFVFPSLYEGFGLPLLEAMQCGTPVIASNVTSIPEVVGDAALLLDPIDRAAWCGAITRILDDDALHHDLRQRGLRRATNFSWQRCVEETVQHYRTILAA